MPDAKIAIVGAGPIGLEFAVACKQSGVDYLHFESGQVAQTISWYPRLVKFFSSANRIAIAGVPLQTADQSKATREEYLAYLRNIVIQFDLDIHTFEKVTQISGSNGNFSLQTTRSGETREYNVQQIVLAVGDMARPRLLHLPGEDLDHVSHYFKEPHQYFRKKLLIVGGKNSAVGAAIFCHRAGADVTISYRRKQFDSERVKYWLLPELEALIQSGHIRFIPETVPTKITPRTTTLEPAEGLIGDSIAVDADFVLLLTGYVMDTTLFEIAGVELQGQNNQPVLDQTTMQSNVPGIYVAGTAAAGTQETYRLFIENCHVHVKRILESITGEPFQADWAKSIQDDTALES